MPATLPDAERQALTYKIGQLQISALRARAERELAARLDLRDFNDAVLDRFGAIGGTGKRMARWVEDLKAH